MITFIFREYTAYHPELLEIISSDKYFHLVDSTTHSPTTTTGFDLQSTNTSDSVGSTSRLGFNTTSSSLVGPAPEDFTTAPKANTVDETTTMESEEIELFNFSNDTEFMDSVNDTLEEGQDQDFGLEQDTETDNSTAVSESTTLPFDELDREEISEDFSSGGSGFVEDQAEFLTTNRFREEELKRFGCLKPFLYSSNFILMQYSHYKEYC